MLQLVLIGVLFGAAATAVAYFVPWLPAADSTQAKRIHFLFWFMTAICIGVFALVAAVIVYSVINFRARPDDDSDGIPLHGNTGLEIVWTAFPAVLVTAITIVVGGHPRAERPGRARPAARSRSPRSSSSGRSSTRSTGTSSRPR